MLSGGSLILSSSSRSRKVAVNRENYLVLYVDIDALCLVGQAYGWFLAILLCLAVCLYIH